MGVSVDGFIADREGAFGVDGAQRRAVPFPHCAGQRARRVPVRPQAVRDHAAVGDGSVDARRRARGRVRRRLVRAPQGRLQPHARHASRATPGSPGVVAEEVAAALDATDKDVAIGGAGLAAAAIELGLVDELRMFRNPIVVGGGTPFLPPVTERPAGPDRDQDVRLPGDLRALSPRPVGRGDARCRPTGRTLRCLGPGPAAHESEGSTAGDHPTQHPHPGLAVGDDGRLERGRPLAGLVSGDDED